MFFRTHKKKKDKRKLNENNRATNGKFRHIFVLICFLIFVYSVLRPRARTFGSITLCTLTRINVFAFADRLI